MKKTALALAVAALASGSAAYAAKKDFGEKMQHLLNAQSETHFGIEIPLTDSFDGNIQRQPGQDADDLVILAKGLQATVLTRVAGNKADMFAFWPNEDNPTHAIFCIEGGDEVVGTFTNGEDKLNPSVQSVDLEDGTVKTILRGMNRCDGIRSTAWGTVLATEETSTGQAYEMLNPTSFENHTVTDRATGTIVDANGDSSDKVAKRDSLPTIAWEGLTVLDSGVVIAGDELRPGDWDLAGDGGDDPDVDGGAIFKFVPTTAHIGGEIEYLTDSPLVGGSVYAFRASCREGTSGSFTINYGQGCEIGNGSWIPVSASEARKDANNNGATGYYRPEDLHRDPTYEGDGVRFCWANTGREAAQNYGEVICGIDSDPLRAVEDVATVTVNRFVEGDEDFNSLDNLAFQPQSGNLYVIEDHKNGDVFACLPDGNDRDIKTDGCVKVLSVKDQTAEPTGFEFFGDGKSAIVAIQHSDDCKERNTDDDCVAEWGDEFPEAKFDDYPTDDILVITGFKMK